MTPSPYLNMPKYTRQALLCINYEGSCQEWQTTNVAIRILSNFLSFHRLDDEAEELVLS